MEQEKTRNSSSKFLFGIVATAALAVAAGLIFWKPTEDAALSSQPENGVGGTPAVADRRKYADGTYSSAGSYLSPAGREEIYVTLVLDGDSISDASVETRATNPTSRMMQGAFSQGFREQVVGKNIDEISLSVVNGSSLTPKGFMDALSEIKAEAQVSA